MLFSLILDADHAHGGGFLSEYWSILTDPAHVAVEVTLMIVLDGLLLGLLWALPSMASLNVMRLASPNSAVLSALVFNALIIPALIPLALKGVRFKPASAVSLLRRNMLVYGVGGVLLPFVGIKAIDLLLAAIGV